MHKYSTKIIGNQIKLNRLKYVINLNPGKFSSKNTDPIPLGILLKMHKFAHTKTIKQIVRKGTVFVNNKKIKCINYPVIPLDIVEYDGQIYRVVLEKKYKLVLVNEPNIYYKINQILTLKNKKFQVNALGGYNIVFDKLPEFSKGISNYVICKNIKTNKVDIMDINNCNSLIVIKGKYKNMCFNQYTINSQSNTVSIENSIINMNYCLFYENKSI